MKKYLLTLALALFALSANAKRTQATLPTDSNLHVGKLPNGLTYYILRNNTPPNRANFYLAQCVGSLQETENQRGLAHFLEHLCFNGTRHFPSNTLVAYLETLGLKFGQNINAYTGMERTVYHLNNVPTARASALDSCLLTLRDWACDISFSPDEINKERGVINEEWRQRNSATARMLQRNLPRLYPNSLYAHRAPIGLMEVIDTVGPSTLRQYYHRWYHPQNQAIIVVGDVDVARTAKRIEALFAPIRPTKSARRPAIVPVADNAKPIVVVDADPEQRTTLVQVFCKMPPITPAVSRGPRLDGVRGRGRRAWEELCDPAPCPRPPGGPWSTRPTHSKVTIVTVACTSTLTTTGHAPRQALPPPGQIAKENHRVHSMSFEHLVHV